MYTLLPGFMSRLNGNEKKPQNRGTSEGWIWSMRQEEPVLLFGVFEFHYYSHIP